MLFGNKGESETTCWNSYNFCAILKDKQGNRYWGMIKQVRLASLESQLDWAKRDLVIVKHSPICISTVSVDSGILLWQNATSTSMFGCHGLFNSLDYLSDLCKNPKQGFSPEDQSAKHSSDGTSDCTSRDGIKFLELLFDGDEGKLQDLKLKVKNGVFCTRQEVTNKSLRFWMGLKQGEEAHHDIQVSLSQDPITLQRVFTISQVSEMEAGEEEGVRAELPHDGSVYS